MIFNTVYSNVPLVQWISLIIQVHPKPQQAKEIQAKVQGKGANLGFRHYTPDRVQLAQTGNHSP
jgi:hypothetical protein